MSKKVTLNHGGSTLSINVNDEATIGDVLRSSAVREDPTMNFGDQPRIVDNYGSTVPASALASDGTVYTVEKAADTKG